MCSSIRNSVVISFQIVYLINFDHCRVKAKDSAIIEYYNLRNILVYKTESTSIMTKKFMTKRDFIQTKIIVIKYN
jgi:hypothetical protein